MGVEKSSRGVVVVERREDLVAGQHARQRQYATGDALRETEKVGRCGVGLLPGEHGPGPAEAGHDFVGDQMHAETRRARAGMGQKTGVVHHHAGRALHQRFEDQRRCGGVVCRKMRVQCCAGSVHADAAARVRAWQQGRLAQQRSVGVAKHGDVGDPERAERFTVVAAHQAGKRALVRKPPIAPVVKTHLQCDLGRGGAVGGIEDVPETRWCKGGETLRQLDHRGMRATCQQHMVELIDLVAQRRADARIGVAEEVDPPRTDGIEVATAIEVVQPCTLGARDRHERQ